MNPPANFTNRALNQDQRHVAWLQRMETPSGRDAAVGAADKVGQHVRAAVVSANTALARLPEKIVAIVADKTRESAALKHDAVRTVGLHTIATLQRSQKAIRDGAADALARSDVAINEAFVPDPVRAGIESEIRGHIRTLAAKPDGLAEIRKLVASDREAAGVFSYSPPYLLNIAPEAKQSIHQDIIRQHIPEAYQLAEESIALGELADRYDKAIGNVRQSWLDGVADGASTRVSLDD